VCLLLAHQRFKVFLIQSLTGPDLPAIAPRCSETDALGLEQHNIIACLSQM
jgi:hypothetical protein